MSTGNPVFDIIEDELIGHLEKSDTLPKHFTVYLEDLEFQALLASGGGIVSKDTGLRLPVTTTRTTLSMAGHDITFRSEKDPDNWAETRH